MRKIPLYLQVIVALALGVSFAALSIYFGWNKFTIDYIDPFGKIFINILKLIAIPLVLFSIISGVSTLKDIRKLGKIGFKTLGLYLLTTLIAVTVGLISVNSIKPGNRVSENLLIENRIAYELWTQGRGIEIKDGKCYSCDEGLIETVKQVGARMALEDANLDMNDKIEKANKTKSSGPLQALVDVVPSNIITAMYSMEMLQVIFFAIFFGIALVLLPEDRAKPVIAFCEGINEVFVKMVDVVMRAMPFFVFCLMAGAIVVAAGQDTSKLAEILSFLLLYSLAVIIGLLFIGGIFYPTLIGIFAKRIGVGKFLKGMSQAQLTAFSTSSSVATLPVTLNAVESNLGVSKRMTSFVLPIGATVNMDGTSLYQAVAVVALAQFHMIDFTLSQQLTIIFTTTLASIGAAAIPSAGLVLLIIVLESVGLNPAWFALIVPVDRILDMCRTVVNVTGDATVASIVASSEGELVGVENS